MLKEALVTEVLRPSRRKKFTERQLYWILFSFDRFRPVVPFEAVEKILQELSMPLRQMHLSATDKIQIATTFTSLHQQSKNLTLLDTRCLVIVDVLCRECRCRCMDDEIGGAREFEAVHVRRSVSTIRHHPHGSSRGSPDVAGGGRRVASSESHRSILPRHYFDDHRKYRPRISDNATKATCFLTRTHFPRVLRRRHRSIFLAIRSHRWRGGYERPEETVPFLTGEYDAPWVEVRLSVNTSFLTRTVGSACPPGNIMFSNNRCLR